MPASTLRWRTFNEKKPYFIATVFSLVAVAFAVGFLFQKLAESKENEIRGLEPQVAKLKAKSDLFERHYRKMQATRREAEQIMTWMEQRYYWGDLLTELRRALIRSEDSIKKKLSAQRAGVEAGVWVEQLTYGMPTTPGASPGTPMTPPPTALPGEGGAAPATDAAANPANNLTLICRAVNLSYVDPTATTVIAYTVENELKASPFFDPKTTALLGNIVTDETTGTFTFGITLGLTNTPNLNL
jgi:hypothetical protein